MGGGESSGELETTAKVKVSKGQCYFVRDPPLLKDQQALQKFALWICYNRRSASYPELLEQSNLPTLSTECLFRKLSPL